MVEFLLQQDTHYKYFTAKEGFETFSRFLRVNPVKDTTISLSKAKKSPVKLITHMYYKDGFELLIEVVFSMIPQLEGHGPKAQYLVIPLRLGEGETLPYFHLKGLAIISELVFIRDQTKHINNLK